MNEKKILVADDDRDFLKIEGQFLEHAGYSVIYAQDAYQALHFALSQSPHLLLLDIHMPAGDGLSVQERIRTTPALRNTPVIYMTGERSAEIEAAAFGLGAAAVLHKPFDYGHLLATIQGVFHRVAPLTAKKNQVLEVGSLGGNSPPGSGLSI